MGETERQRERGRGRDREGEKERQRERRSEAHTSDLQSQPSLSYAAFCLKKQKTKRK